MSAPLIRDTRQVKIRLTRLENPSDEQIMRALGDGGYTWRVAGALGMPARCAYVRSRLIRLETAGQVRRSIPYTFDNGIYWLPTSTSVSG